MPLSLKEKGSQNSSLMITCRFLHWCSLVVIATACSWGMQQQSKKQDQESRLHEYAGVYQDEHKRSFVISLGEGHISYVDVATDLSDELTESAKDEFRAKEQDVVIHFARDEHGSIEGLHFTGRQTPEVYAARIPNQEQELRVRSQNAEIRGMLIIPPVDHKVAAILIEGGSGWKFDKDVITYARLATIHGFAGVVWDRRGWGASTGEKAASFEDLAVDVAAITNEIRKNPKIDSAKIGFWGFSQAGWVGTLAASSSKDVAFLVLFSPALTFPFRQEEENISHTLQADGESAAQIQSALDLFHAKLEYALFGSDWQKYETLREKLLPNPWFRFLDAPEDPSDPVFQFLRLNAHYNSLKALTRIHVPVLALFGEFDTNVLPDAGRSLLEQAMDLAGNPDLEMHTIPNANHSLLGVRSAKPNDFIDPVRYAPGVWDTLWDWLVRVVPK